MTQIKMQIGKNELTSRFIEELKKSFEKHQNIKISVLKGAEHNREKMKKISREILDSLGNNYTAKIIGFTIFIKKWRKSIR